MSRNSVAFACSHTPSSRALSLHSRRRALSGSPSTARASHGPSWSRFPYPGQNASCARPRRPLLQCTSASDWNLSAVSATRSVFPCLQNPIHLATSSKNVDTESKVEKDHAPTVYSLSIQEYTNQHNEVKCSLAGRVTNERGIIWFFSNKRARKLARSAQSWFGA